MAQSQGSACGLPMPVLEIQLFGPQLELQDCRQSHSGQFMATLQKQSFTSAYSYSYSYSCSSITSSSIKACRNV